MKITIEQLFISCYFPFSFINYINIIMETFVCNAELCSIKGLLPKRKTKNLLLLNEEENRIILSSSHDLRANLLYFDMWLNKQEKLLYYFAWKITSVKRMIWNTFYIHKFPIWGRDHTCKMGLICIDVILDNYNHECSNYLRLRQEILILSFLNTYFILDSMAIAIGTGIINPIL